MSTMSKYFFFRKRGAKDVSPQTYVVERNLFWLFENKANNYLHFMLLTISRKLFRYLWLLVAIYEFTLQVSCFLYFVADAEA